jgi:hypothetical protein
VVASSYTSRYLVSTDVSQVFLDELMVIRNALDETLGGVVKDTPQGQHASVARPIWNKDGKSLGGV